MQGPERARTQSLPDDLWEGACNAQRTIVALAAWERNAPLNPLH
jgi:hypothetical protein